MTLIDATAIGDAPYPIVAPPRSVDYRHWGRFREAAGPTGLSPLQLEMTWDVLGCLNAEQAEKYPRPVMVPVQELGEGFREHWESVRLFAPRLTADWIGECNGWVTEGPQLTCATVTFRHGQREVIAEEQTLETQILGDLAEIDRSAAVSGERIPLQVAKDTGLAIARATIPYLAGREGIRVVAYGDEGSVLLSAHSSTMKRQLTFEVCADGSRIAATMIDEHNGLRQREFARDEINTAVELALWLTDRA